MSPEALSGAGRTRASVSPAMISTGASPLNEAYQWPGPRLLFTFHQPWKW